MVATVVDTRRERRKREEWPTMCVYFQFGVGYLYCLWFLVSLPPATVGNLLSLYIPSMISPNVSPLTTTHCSEIIIFFFNVCIRNNLMNIKWVVLCWCDFNSSVEMDVGVEFPSLNRGVMLRENMYR